MPDQGRRDGERTGGRFGGWLTGGCQHNQSLKPGQGAAGVLRRIRRVDVEASRWWCPAGCARGWAGPRSHTGGWGQARRAGAGWQMAAAGRRAGGGQLVRASSFRIAPVRFGSCRTRVREAAQARTECALLIRQAPGIVASGQGWDGDRCRQGDALQGSVNQGSGWWLAGRGSPPCCVGRFAIVKWEGGLRGRGTAGTPSGGRRGYAVRATAPRPRPRPRPLLP